MNISALDFFRTQWMRVFTSPLCSSPETIIIILNFL